jgi:AcrR family transcriptional regulator
MSEDKNAGPGILLQMSTVHTAAREPGANGRRLGTRRTGRPPDPDMEARVFQATLDLYLELGWGKLSFDLVARRAGAGKAALYRRWSSIEELVVAALSSRVPRAGGCDTGSLRGDLRELAILMMRRYLSDDGLVDLRSLIDAKINSETFGDARRALSARQRTLGREITARAARRGELPGTSNADAILEAVNGGVLFHFLMTPPEAMTVLSERVEEYADRIVEVVLNTPLRTESGRATEKP